MGNPVYLDHNATTTPRPKAVTVMVAALAEAGNPSSVHGAGREARKTIEEARSCVAALVNANPDDVIFTSGGTESNHLAIAGCGRKRVLVSAIEHPSVRNCGGEIVPVDRNGIVDVVELDAMLMADATPALVSVMLANNETGVIEPIDEIAEIARRHNALMHSDAVQAAGKIAVDFKTLGVDKMSLSAHKIGGPAGVGALIANEKARGVLKATAFGGGQERGLRQGTENIAGIAGFGAAAKAALSDLSDHAQIAKMRDRLETAIMKMSPDTIIFGADADRLPNTACFTMPGSDSDTQVMALDLAGIAVSAGSACASGKVKASGVLHAMGIDDDQAKSALRVSFGWDSKDGDVDAFLNAWGDLYERIHK
ncbi:MAG: cysteine desulfurase, partial [Rhodospirillaceae bacterium]|nr:cysteine desulfurase [Rhodospirillaceae bacterium]